MVNLPLEIDSQVHDKCLYWHMGTVRSNLEHQNPYGGLSTWCLQSHAVTHVCGCMTQTIILSSTHAHHSFIRKCDYGQVTSPGHFGFLLKWVVCTAWELRGREPNWRPSYQGPLSCCCWSTSSDREEVITVWYLSGSSLCPTCPHIRRPCSFTAYEWMRVQCHMSLSFQWRKPLFV